MFRRMLAALLVFLLLIVPGMTAFGDDQQEEDSVVSEAKTEDTEPEKSSAGNTDIPDVDESDMQIMDTVDVLVPADIPFDIVILKSSGTGIVASKEFKIINKGENGISVKFSSINLEISDKANFTICDTADLPEEGNNIYVELFCSSDGSSESIPLTGASAAPDYEYYLESGGMGTFWLEGVVNEFGDVLWSDISVKISICFSMAEDGVAIESLMDSDHAEPEEAPGTAEGTAVESDENSDIPTDGALSEEPPDESSDAAMEESALTPEKEEPPEAENPPVV